MAEFTTTTSIPVDSIRLISAEDESFVIPIKVASVSNFIKSALDDQNTEEDLPLPNVKSKYLTRVIDFCKHYVEEAMHDIERVSHSFNILMRIYDNVC